MNRKVRYISAVLLLAALTATLASLAHKSQAERGLVSCNSLEVVFLDSLEFVSEKDVKNYIGANYGQYVGQHMDSVDLARIEGLLRKKSVIMKSEAWMTDDGTLHVSIAQRAPVLRFKDGDYGFYVDREGYVFPLHKSYTADVPVIEGRLPFRPAAGYDGEAASEKDRLWIAEMLEFNRRIEDSRTWRKLVRRIMILDDGDIALTTAKGGELFILGGTGQLKEKFSKIEKYYSYIAPQKGENHYKTVNLKYKGQIICREKGI